MKLISVIQLWTLAMIGISLSLGRSEVGDATFVVKLVTLVGLSFGLGMRFGETTRKTQGDEK